MDNMEGNSETEKEQGKLKYRDVGIKAVDKSKNKILSETDIFYIITKRIDRFMDCIPADWGDGWGNVTICSTCENQDRADYRLPILSNG